jgi:hypothetical protein
VPCTNLDTILCVTLKNETTESSSSNNNNNSEIHETTINLETSTVEPDPLEVELQKEMIYVRDFLRARPLLKNGDVKLHPFENVTKNTFDHERDFSDPNLELKSIPPHIYVNSNGTLIISGQRHIKYTYAGSDVT